MQAGINRAKFRQSLYIAQGGALFRQPPPLSCLAAPLSQIVLPPLRSPRTALVMVKRPQSVE